MKKVFMFTLIIFGAMTFLMQSAMAKPPTPKPPKAAKFNAVSRLAHAGDIHGSVSCFSSVEVVDSNFVMVFIPGTSFVAVPDVDGNFTIYNVPEGTYDVQIVADDAKAVATTGPLTETISSFTVFGKVINELCPQ